jgi:hypothetical protein
MQIPIKSERDVFRLVAGLGIGCVIAVILAVTVSVVVGVVVFAVAFALIMTALLVAARHEKPHALRDAVMESAQRPPDLWRILVIANEALSGDALEKEIARHSTDNLELLVVAPVLVSRTRFVTTDVDRAMNQARDRLAKTLVWGRERGVKAEGHIGDPVAPMLAVEDELRRFSPNEILVVNHPAESANWMEAGFVERIREELDLPVSYVEVTGDHSDD